MLSREQFYSNDGHQWFGPSQRPPDWQDPHAKAVACLIQDGAAEAVFLMFNASDNLAIFHIPVPPNQGRWRLAVDTSRDEHGG